MRALILKNLKNIYSNKELYFVPLFKKTNVIYRFQSTSVPEVYELKNLPNASHLYKKILSSDLLNLVNLFSKYNFEIRIAGGAVRDILMGIEPHDVDLATNALPEQMLDIFRKENIRIYNQNGIKHGTVTVRINDRVRNIISKFKLFIPSEVNKNFKNYIERF